MDANEMKFQAEVLYDRISSKGAPGFTDREWGVLLTKAEEIFVKTGYNPYESFEETEKRRKDFSELKRGSDITTLSSSQTGVRPNGVFFDLPDDFLWAVGEEVTISSSDSCVDGDRISVKPITEDEYSINKNNPQRNPHTGLTWRMDYSRETVGTNPKRHELLTDGTYTISTYHLRYIKRPQGITPFTGDGTTSAQIDSELDDISHRPIIDIAVRIATGITEAQNYQIKLNEENINE